MRQLHFHRRTFLAAGAASAALSALTGRAAAAITEQAAPMALPPPITRAERLARIGRAQALMASSGIGAVLIESGPSLDYFTGIQWWRSERLTAVVIPAQGDPIVVTPFFEGPTIREMLAVPAEVRTWQEDEEPLKLVADFLREKGVAGAPIGFEETNRFFIADRLRQALPAANIVSANPAVRALRMIKTPAELALMQAAADITLSAYRTIAPQIREGMTPAEIDRLYVAAVTALGGKTDGGLILLGEAAAYPHGSGKPQHVRKGEVVLLDCGCDVHGYQSDISRTFVFGADPSVEQRKVWDQMRRGMDIAMAAAKVGAPAGSVDDAVRSAYESWGYGPRYKLPGTSHRTGHGIGMEGHEPINLVHGEATPLAPGMCFSNEPGIYLPGKFGIRLEDCFHMTATGPRWFTQPPPSIDQPFG
ncbi:aminopeptidase P family protein [Sphingomonas sabuli]|uniref:Aminopeptidase P family protein n=1 Tax=Sphingomonas sabuli TaxID=2764186 RepID=A0A7G9L354_9SPHN|nr:Xaa-Pro peptidase family protein [Sphingomonas sabuli]QNM83053.1 aminopeptidase P family protein [Sphingomonas sabuli]